MDSPDADGTIRQRSPAGTWATVDPSGSLRTSASTPPTVTAAPRTAIPTRTSGSTATGAGGADGAGTAAGTQLPVPTKTPTTSRSLAAVVAKFELETEILCPQVGDHRLQLVFRRTGHPDLIALNARLGLLETAVLDRLH